MNKENRLCELNSDQEGKGLKDYLEQVLETFDSQGDNKKREIIQTIIPRIQVVPKNKLRLHIRTDFRSGNSGAKNSTADFGHGVASYLSPTGLEQKGKNLNLSSVTSGGNFSSRDKLAGQMGRV